MSTLEASAEEPPRITWQALAQVFTRPQPVTIPMVTLFAIIPFYLVIGAYIPGRTVHVPEVALDRALPLLPAWSGVYASLFCAALLPVFVVHQQELVRRHVHILSCSATARRKLSRSFAVMAKTSFHFSRAQSSTVWPIP